MKRVRLGTVVWSAVSIVVLLVNMAGAFEWSGDEKVRVKTAQSAKDAKTPGAVDFLITGFDDQADKVAVRCMDYAVRLVVVDGVAYDKEKLCDAAVKRIPARTYALTEKLCDVVVGVSPSSRGRKKLEELLLSDDVKNCGIAVRALIGISGTRDFMANIKDAIDRKKDQPAGDHDSLAVIQKAAKKFKDDAAIQIYAVRAIGVLGTEQDVPKLAEILKGAETKPLTGDKKELDRVVYAIQAAAKFTAGKPIIEPLLKSPNMKVQKEARKALNR